MTLLRDIQDAATEGSVPVAILLRKCKILAARLDHAPFAEWVERELNGYPSQNPDGLLPAYRKLRNTEARGNFSAGFGHYINGGLIARECIDEEDRLALFSVDLIGPVAEYEALLAQTSQGEGKGGLRSPWPTASVIKYADRVWELYSCTEAWRSVSSASIAAVLDSIRNRVLSFALDIERENPDAGEAALGDVPVANDAVERAFVVNVMGGSPIIAEGNIGAVMQIAGIDWEGLQNELRAYGLPAADIDALGDALVSDQGTTGQGQVGPATQSWIGRVTTKIETGALDLVNNASGGVIAGVVLKALGVG